jgi:hypothetical protein
VRLDVWMRVPPSGGARFLFVAIEPVDVRRVAATRAYDEVGAAAFPAGTAVAPVASMPSDIGVLPRRAFAAFAAFAAVSSLSAACRAETGSAATDAAKPHRATQLCASMGFGLAPIVVDGIDYAYRYVGTVPVVDGQFGYCAHFASASAAVRVVIGSSFVWLVPALSLRLHTGTPAAEGIEVGLGARFGLSYLNVTRSTSDYSSFAAIGWAASGGPDLRYWLDSQSALVLAGDVALAHPQRDGEGTNHTIGAIAVTGGWALRF